MNAPLWVHELAEAFWNEVGEPEPFPRMLLPSLLRTSWDLTVEELPDLTVQHVYRYLTRVGFHPGDGVPDRPLHACLFAYRGCGWIFLDAADTHQQRVLSLAHELAHYLRHYLQPRQQLVQFLGKTALSALDGECVPSPVQRVQALLRHTPLVPFTHWMSRARDWVRPEILHAEQEADLLAFELLAPAEEVGRRLPTVFSNEELLVVLQDVFGLDESASRAYAEILRPVESVPEYVLRLKKAQQKCRTSDRRRESDSGGSRDEHPT